ncbi:MAG TPA: DUF3592 domain-containing protein [Hyphomonas sp.]|nr:DUF3592 domain-containing protein [Hyphomonas sp.]
MRWLFVLLFAGLGAMLIYVGVTQFFLQRRIAANARPVDAEITRSDITKSVSMDTDRSVARNTSTTSYTPNVAFRYSVNGTVYESDMFRPNIIGTGYSSHEDAAAELAPFPLGAKVTAWVDEAHPDKAFLILEKGNGPIVFMLVGPLAFAAAYLAFRFL